MYKIVSHEELVQSIHSFVVEAPEIAAKAQPGQFVVVRVDEQGERIPLTLADWDRKSGTLTLVAQRVGTSTAKLAALGAGDAILNVVGPLGLASEIEKFGTVVCVGGGVGVAPVYPIVRALRENGNKVISIMGARNKDLLFWEDKMRRVSDELIVMTDDGSHGRKGVVTIPLKEVLEKGGVARVVAIGPGIMMKFSAATTKPFGVKTVVSLNSIMVDGTGMCGSCRVSVGGATKFACVDGPEFNGHEVDWDLLQSRQKMYLESEKKSFEQWLSCHCVKV